MHRLQTDTASTFPQRLGYYILGIAIGLVVLGMFQMQRRFAAQQQAAAQRSSERAPPSLP